MKMEEKNIWEKLGVSVVEEGGKEERVVRDVLSSMRRECLNCRKCVDGNFKWKLGMELNDEGLDVWFVYCEERGLRLYNRISGRLKGLISGRIGWYNEYNRYRV